VEIDLGGMYGILRGCSRVKILKHRGSDKDILHLAAAGTAEMGMGSGIGIDEDLLFIDGKNLYQSRICQNLGSAIDGGVRDGGKVFFELLINSLRRGMVFASVKQFENADSLGGDLEALVSKNVYTVINVPHGKSSLKKSFDNMCRWKLRGKFKMLLCLKSFR
jgi:hypothetical protein